MSYWLWDSPRRHTRVVARRESVPFRAIALRAALCALARAVRMTSRGTLRAAFFALALASRVLAIREPRVDRAVELSSRRVPSDVASSARSRDALASRAPSGYDEAEAERFVSLAGAAYCDAGLDTWTCLYCNGTRVSDVTVFTSDKTNVHGYVGWDDERRAAVVAFRGTEPSSLENWLENLDASHATWEIGACGYRRAFRVHAGFLDAYASVRDVIFDALRSISAARRLGKPSEPLPVALTGHSLGGALATLAAFELDAEGFRPDGDISGDGDGDGDGGRGRGRGHRGARRRRVDLRFAEGRGRRVRGGVRGDASGAHVAHHARARRRPERSRATDGVPPRPHGDFLRRGARGWGIGTGRGCASGWGAAGGRAGADVRRRG